MGDEDDLTVAEAAEALGTSPQTVRALLRKGELAGRKRPWGSRYVWVPSRAGVDYFLSVHGRLDGHRRRPVVEAPAEEATAAVPPPAAEALAPPHSVPPELRTDTLLSFEAVERPALRPFVLRPRGRATVVVVVLGVPLLLAYGTARILPGALWFNELDQSDVFRRVLLARVEFFLLIAGTAALFMAANLGIAARHSDFARTRPGRATIAAASFVTGTLFASSVEGHWQTFRLVAAPAELRRRRPGLRQGRRLLRLLTPVRALGVGAAALAHCGGRRFRGAGVPRTTSGRLPATSRHLRSAGASRLARRDASSSSSRGGFTWSGTYSSSASHRQMDARSRVPATSTPTSGFQDSAYSLVCRSCSLSPASPRRSLPELAPDVVQHCWSVPQRHCSSARSHSSEP